MDSDEAGSRESIARIDELARTVEGLRDPFARAAALDLAQGIMALHAEALGRVMEILAAGGGVERLAADELVGGVLAMHDLHPDPVETRIGRAVEKLRVWFDTRGAGIALVEASAESVRVRVTGCRPGAAEAARKAIEETIYGAAPEVERLEVEGLEEAPAGGFVPIASLVAGRVG